MDPVEATGQTFLGKVKSYVPSKGYGFVTCDKLSGDLFFLHHHLPKDVVGDVRYNWLELTGREVAFTSEVSEEGKPIAADIRIISQSHNHTQRSGNTYSKGGKGFKGSKGGKKGAARWEAPMVEYYEKPKHPKHAAAPAKAAKAPVEEGVPMLDGARVQGTMKSYSAQSRWGFAVVNVDEVGEDLGDIFVHMNNLDESLASDKEVVLREGDMVEFRLEEIEGKSVAKDVTVVEQDASVYEGQWMTGVVTNVCFITSPRITGNIRFNKVDAVVSMRSNKCIGWKVLFKLTPGIGGAKPTAKFVTPLEDGMKPDEARKRAEEVVDTLSEEGYIDETAVKSMKTLSNSDPMRILTLLPDLEFYRAENPSSFILGALNRKGGESRKGWSKGAKGTGYGPARKGYSKGKGKGKGYSPY